MKISNKNIRATVFQEFWSDEYKDSLYLWQGSKHHSTLADIDTNPVPTCKDYFTTQKEIEAGHEFCKKFYYKILPELTVSLNNAHNLDLPVSFWQVVFGYWLYRHISIVYDKYVYLSALDIDRTSLKLLSKEDFYIPQNHVDYIFCFASDFGVQQLVSQYYYLFKTKEFTEVHRTFTHGDTSSNNDTLLSRVKRNYSMLKFEPEIALLGAYFSANTVNILGGKSSGRINSIVLPITEKKTIDVDFVKRRCISNSVVENSFDSYFMQSLYYCLPKDILEGFFEYYSVYQKDIKSRKFTHIVSEDWISNISNAIYIALAKENKVRFISHEHGAGTCYYKNFLHFIDYGSADIYLSVGWKENGRNFIPGGFTCRDIIPYKQDSNKETILFITRTKFIYWEEFNEYNASNSTFIKEVAVVADFIRLFPQVLKEKLLFRPRPAKLFWDVEHLLELEKHNVKVDRGDFTESISKSRIVVTDHMSTGFAEILLMKVPFILVYDISFLPLTNELRQIFDDLISCGVVHLSASSAVSHLSSIYDDVEGWWQSESVCRSVGKLIDVSLAPPNRTTDYLLSLLSGDSKSQPTLQYRFLTWSEDCAKRAYRLMKKSKSLISSRAK
ncbi:MAG: hypothetical protein HGB23_01370 [Chlorobiaceae bacterium]|nr:hypothetical protein [Chlorobiaceae bacterium]